MHGDQERRLTPGERGRVSWEQGGLLALGPPAEHCPSVLRMALLHLGDWILSKEVKIWK